MMPMDFARSYLQPFTVKGSEIIPQYCPFCHGGQHRDKKTFALNMENRTFNCRRGSCGVQGHFTQLCREFGVQSMNDDYNPPQKVYKKPEQKPKPVHEAAGQYLRLRGISKATAEVYRIGTDNAGNLLFPYFTDTGDHVFNKFRFPRKLQKGERKAWRERDTMPILFGMHLCDTTKPLTITEGELDAMACHEAGIPNAVSVPSGAEDFAWLDTCWDFIQQFESIYLYGDNDAAGRDMIRRLSVKLSDKRIFVVAHACKDANELLYRHGPQTVKAAWEAAKEVPVAGLINLATVTPLDVESIPSISTSIHPLNQRVGGFYLGDVSVWTGRRGEGKSTLLSQLCLDAIEGGEKVCAYSGELRADRFQFWVDLQAAGKDNIEEYYDRVNDRQVYYVPQSIRNQIHSWYGRRFWLYDNAISGTEEELSIIKIFELAAKRYDCKMFLVDNLMTADYGRMSDSDFYRQQSRFVGQLVTFANRHNVHVHLVAHPRKTKGNLDSDDVSGSGDITNRAANVFSLSKQRDGQGVDLLLEIKKNRWEGNCGTIALNYCKVSHRLYVPEAGNTKRYGWEAHKDEEWVQIDLDGDLPF